MRTLSLLLIVLTGLGLGFLGEERGAPRMRLGPLSFPLALGVSTGTGVPEPAGSKEPESALSQVVLSPIPSLQAAPLLGEEACREQLPWPISNGDTGAWVAETRRQQGLLRMILIPKTQALGSGSPDPRTAPSAEMLERLLELEAHLDRQRLFLIRERIS